MIGYWHDNVVCLSVSDAVHWLNDTSYAELKINMLYYFDTITFTT